MKIFCISYQRTGTTSTGRFLRDLGYRWAGWKTAETERWCESWLDGDFEAIFRSQEFQQAQAFEDAPWFFPDFFKQLYHRFPGAKFILLKRDPQKWFQSMITHSGGWGPGEPSLHAKIYRREVELIIRQAQNQSPEPSRLRLEGMEKHYTTQYQQHIFEALKFFRSHGPEALFHGNLEDPDIWIKMGQFLGHQVPPNYRCHENKTVPAT